MAWKEMAHSEDMELVKEYPQQLRSGKSSHVLYRIVKEDGGVCWIKCSDTPIVDSFGKLIMLDGMVFDITEQKT